MHMQIGRVELMRIVHWVDAGRRSRGRIWWKLVDDGYFEPMSRRSAQQRSGDRAIVGANVHSQTRQGLLQIAHGQLIGVGNGCGRGTAASTAASGEPDQGSAAGQR